jgi:major membrane immunogen (membrane-anchored lipoprotein)
MKHAIGVILASVVLLTACSTNPPTASNSHVNHNQKQSSEHSNHNQKQSSNSHEADHQDPTKVIYSFKEGKAKAKKDTTIQIQIHDEKGQPVQKFDTTHEKKLHLIAVSKDLSYFSHIHPEWKGNGLFEIKTQFPAGGEYKLYSDFVPTFGSATTKSEWVKVKGQTVPAIPVKPDSQLTKSVDGKEITLTIDQLKAGKEAALNFHIKDNKSKKPITNLQQYLGAVGHVVILTEDANEYLHVHPMEEKATGPDAKFMTTFPKSGIYKIWGQFQHEGKVITVPFVVKVP